MCKETDLDLDLDLDLNTIVVLLILVQMLISPDCDDGVSCGSRCEFQQSEEVSLLQDYSESKIISSLPHLCSC